MSSAPRHNRSVSIIIPVYQGADFVVHTLRSVSAQTYSDIDIVVVNDGSTDNTRELLRDYGRHEPRLRIVDLPTNEGVHRARATGISVAKGSLLGFLDADDRFHPEAVERMLTALKQNDADIVICGVRFLSSDGSLAEHKVKFRETKVVDVDILRHYCALDFGTGSLWNKLYLREVLVPSVTHDFGERISINEDHIVNFGAFSAAKRVCVLPDTLYFYRQHSHSVTALGKRGHAFAQMLRAYVICLETYCRNDMAARGFVDLLYTGQLRFDAYRVDRREELHVEAGHVAESLQRLAAVHPLGAYELCHLFDDRHQESGPTGSVARQLVRKACRLLTKGKRRPWLR